MRVVFFGSDEFSIKALEACLHSDLEVVRVITTPAKKRGRGLHLEPTKVFAYAQSKHLSVSEFPRLRDPETVQSVLELRPDIFVVASYGKLIPPELLTIPKYRLNVHPSLLPLYRGAAPIHWPILNGDSETGVSIIDIVEKLDAGDIYCQETIPIDSRMTAVRLHAELASLSYGILKKVLQQIKMRQLKGTPQDETKATMARQLRKEDGELSFSEPAAALDRKVRGLQPWPGSFFFLKGERIAVLESNLFELAEEKTPGTLLFIEKSGGIVVATGHGAIRLLQVRPEGKKIMSAADFARGRHLCENDVLAA